MRMLNGSVLVNAKKEDDNKTSGGIFLIKEEKAYKVVEVVQPDSEGVVEKGDTLYVPIHAGTEVEINNEKFLIVNIKEIILIL